MGVRLIPRKSSLKHWIPAFAGMTKGEEQEWQRGKAGMDMRTAGNTGETG